MQRCRLSRWDMHSRAQARSAGCAPSCDDELKRWGMCVEADRAYSKFEGNVKILFFSTDKYPAFRVDVAVLFGQELAGRGNRIDWILQSDADCRRPYKTNWGGGEVTVGSTDNGTTWWHRARKHLLKLINDLRGMRKIGINDYDVVLVKDEFVSAVPIALATRLFGSKFVYWLSYPFPEASLHRAREGTARYRTLYLVRGYIYKWLLYNCIMPMADRVFVQSEQMKADVVNEGICAAKLSAVPMGVCLAEMLKGIKKDEGDGLETGAGRKVVYLGTLSKVRRLDFLIRVFARVLAEQPDAQLVFVGKGDDRSDEELISKEAERYGISRSVMMKGFLPMEEAWATVLECDVCVSPFYPTFILNSTSPTKLIEYMALGRPVVANDHPEQAAILRESGGGICVPYDEEAFADAIIKLLRQRSAALEMGRRGQRYIRKMRDYTVIAESVEKELELVVKGEKGRCEAA